MRDNVTSFEIENGRVEVGEPEGRDRLDCLRCLPCRNRDLTRRSSQEQENKSLERGNLLLDSEGDAFSLAATVLFLGLDYAKDCRAHCLNNCRPDL